MTPLAPPPPPNYSIYPLYSCVLWHCVCMGEHIWNDVNKDMRYLKCILALPSVPRATQQKTPDKLSTNDKTQQIKHMRVV